MDKKVRAQELGNEILDFVNVYGCDAETFAETISSGHRTLQQSTMRLFMTAIRLSSSSDAKKPKTYALCDEDVKAIENFITKDDSVMNFKEMQAIVKMQYGIYKRAMTPTYIRELGKRDDLTDLFEEAERKANCKCKIRRK